MVKPLAESLRGAFDGKLRANVIAYEDDFGPRRRLTLVVD